MALKNGRQSADLRTILVGSVIPPGTIAPFGGGTVPAGWMLCDGTAISRTTYSALFAAVSTTYGIGDGASTFNLPNAQGVFLRGAGSQTISSVTYSATRGSKQNDSLQNITGQGPESRAYGYNVGEVSGAIGIFNSAGNAPGTGSSGSQLKTWNFDASRVARTSTETRPANIGVNYIIKL